MAGRRGKYTPELANLIIGAIQVGATDGDACAVAGIGTTTFYRWQESNREFRERVQRARPAGWIEDLRLIRKAGQEGDWRAAAEHLDRTKSPYRKSVEVTGKDGGPIMLDPGWAALRSVVLAAVAANPDVLPAIEDALLALGDGNE